jgi:hypothetical protein
MACPTIRFFDLTIGSDGIGRPCWLGWVVWKRWERHLMVSIRPSADEVDLAKRVPRVFCVSRTASLSGHSPTLMPPPTHSLYHYSLTGKIIFRVWPFIHFGSKLLMIDRRLRTHFIALIPTTSLSTQKSFKTCSSSVKEVMVRPMEMALATKRRFRCTTHQCHGMHFFRGSLEHLCELMIAYLDSGNLLTGQKIIRTRPDGLAPYFGAVEEVSDEARSP